MSREIKFTGQRIDNKEWVYGFYYSDPEDGHIIFDFHYENVPTRFDEPPEGYFKKICFEVIPESIGQFTGLKDKNGVEIYEGDILLSISDKIFIVEFIGAGFKLCQNNNKRFYSTTGTSSLEVIGNIHANPELLHQQ